MSHSKSTRHKRSQSTRQQAFRLAVMPAMMTAAIGYMNGAWAVQGGVVAAGSGTINTQGNNTTITQGSDRMVVNWTNFDIARNQAVAIKQPSASSAILNRVATAAPTQIDGTLTANGRVFVVNPAGVMFGKTSSVNVGSLVASTLNVDDKQFMDGGDARGLMNLSANGGTGVVSNDGQLSATEAVVLLGAKATNQGTIRAKDVTLGAADGVAMQMSNSGFKVMLGREAQNALAANSGVITANGGNVQLNAAATGAMLATVVQNSGTLEATRASSGEGGSIILGSQLDGNISAGGRINAATDITIGSAPVSYPPTLSPFDAATAPTGGEYGSTGHNVTIEKGAYLTTSQGAVSIGTGGGDVVSNGRISSGGDVKIGAGGTGAVAVNEAINGRSVAVQGTGVDINSWMTASTGDLSIKADGAGAGNLNQNANLEASRGSVNLTGTNVTQKTGTSTYGNTGVSISATGALQAARVNGNSGDVQLAALSGPLTANNDVNGRSVSMLGTGVNINSSISASTGDVSIKADGLGKGDLNQNANVTASRGSVNLAGTNIAQKKGIGTYAGDGVKIGATGALQAARVSATGDVQIGAAGAIAVNDAINGRSVSMQGTGVDVNSWINASTGDVSIKADGLGKGDLNQNADVKAFKGSVNLTGTNVTQKLGYVTYAGNGVNIGASNALQVARVDAVGDVQLGAPGAVKVVDGINGSSVSMQGTGVDLNSWITATKGDVSIKADSLGKGDLNQNANVTANQGSVNLTGTNIVQKKGIGTYAGDGVKIGATGALQAARVSGNGDIQIGAAGPIAVNDAINGRSVSMQGTGVDVNSWINASTGDVSIKANGLGKGDLNQNGDVKAFKGSVNLTGTNVTQKLGYVTYAGNGVNIGASNALQVARVDAVGDVQLGAPGAVKVVDGINGSSVSMQGTGVDLNSWITATKGDVSIKANGLGQGDLNQNANITASNGSVLLTGTNVVQKNGVVTNAGGGISIGADGNIQTARLIGGGDVQVGTLEGSLVANNAINGRSVSLQGTGVETNGSINASTGDVSIEADAFGSGDLKQNADINSSKGSVLIKGTNVFQKNGVNTIAGDGVQIGANDTILASRLSAGGDVLVGTDYGPLAVNGAINARSVSLQGSDLEINAPITASTGNVSVKADGAGEGDLKQFANVTASKGSVLLTGTNVLQRSGVSTTAGDGVSIGASNIILAQRLNAGGDVKLGATGDGAITVNGAVNGRSVSMQGTGVNINANAPITASTGDVSISSDSASGGNLKQSANITASKGSVYLTGSNVVQDIGVSTVAGDSVKIGTSGTLQTGLLSGKTVSLEGDTVYLIRDVNADGDIVVHSTNNVCVPGTGCTDSSTKGIYQLGNVTSRKGSIMMAVDPGISFDPITGIPTIAYTGLIGQYPTSQTRAGVDISLRAVAVYAANNTAGKSITVESLAPTYWGKLTAPQITLPTPITVSDNGDSSGGGR
ncbi:filamentous hemagglutinin N-terminal domain-containing protein [Paraburkholderia silviterrae]|uniref:Filamentous hemagglutinin N-terminal domain-containing protein n=1 Tax=Paraburkholderia silviterrae TaxID=2528715 RepID=A0A4R5M123_9BURK|nr:filamentous hemagglutinin N-terminal domain-containing protein [Paraburkholderia silviterrae]TDG18710.1 filamentous hemagglutinin N-terminal domain-containing protein [Paraburkholderia silviterrae]